MDATPSTKEPNPLVVEIDRLMEILPKELIGEYLKFDQVCDMLLDLRQKANEN